MEKGPKPKRYPFDRWGPLIPVLFGLLVLGAALYDYGQRIFGSLRHGGGPFDAIGFEQVKLLLFAVPFCALLVRFTSIYAVIALSFADPDPFHYALDQRLKSIAPEPPPA